MELFSSEEKNIIDKVFLLRENRQLSKALKLLHELEVKHFDNPTINGLLGMIYFQNKRYKQSEKYFKRTTTLNESSEMASVCLFHSYINNGKTMEALREMYRFVSSKKVVHYKYALKDITDNKTQFNAKERELISQILACASSI